MRSDSPRPRLAPGLLLALAFACTRAPTGDAANRPSAAPALADERVFRHVTVVPMDRPGTLADRRVRVRGDRILAVEPDDGRADDPAVFTIDGTGLVLLPGLVDFHTHPEGPEEFVSYASHGVTTIVSLGGEGLLLHPAIPGLDLPPVHVVSSTPILDHSVPDCGKFYCLDDPAHAGPVLDDALAAGAHLTKIYSDTDAPHFRALVDESRRRGLPVVGHIPRGLPESLVLGPGGLDVVAHGEEFFHYLSEAPAAADIDRLARQVAGRRIAVVPNLVAHVEMVRHMTDPAEVLRDPGVDLLPASKYQEWLPHNNRYAVRSERHTLAARTRARLPVLEQLTRSLHAHGVVLFAGSDTPVIGLPGASLVDEVILLAAAIGPEPALRAATAAPGQFLADRAHQPLAGVVAPGARADLVLLRGDPTRDITALRAVEGVMIGGRWAARADLERMRAGVRRWLAARRADVDTYERLFAARDIPGIVALADRLGPDDRTLNLVSVYLDALALESEQRQRDAVVLLTHVAPTIAPNPALYTLLARLRLALGHTAGARRAYEHVLTFMPYHGEARAGLARTSAPMAP